MRRRGNISLKLLAQLLVKGGFDHIITVDLVRICRMSISTELHFESPLYKIYEMAIK
jgi:phosphoribosylpyrophosphate synthetase